MQDDLKRVSVNSKASIYEGQDGDIYLLRKADRAKVDYFIQVKRKGEKIPSYLSGLFKTKNPERLSMDIKDELGLKISHFVNVIDAGARLEIREGRA